MEHEFYECPEYLSSTPAEVERTEEYEYEVQFGELLLICLISASCLALSHLIITSPPSWISAALSYASISRNNQT